MAKVEKGGGDTVNRRYLTGLVFVEPNIPAQKYGRDMEIEAANTFIESIKRNHTDVKLSDCGLFVDEKLRYVGASPDRVFCEHVVKRLVWKSNALIQ